MTTTLLSVKAAEKREACKRVSLYLNKDQMRFLNHLLKTGLWGRSRSDVAKRLVDRQLAEIFFDVVGRK